MPLSPRSKSNPLFFHHLIVWRITCSSPVARIRPCIPKIRKVPSGPRSAPTTKSSFLPVRKPWRVGVGAARKLLPLALPTKTFPMSSCEPKPPSPAHTRNWKRTITIVSFAASFPKSAVAISPPLPRQPWRRNHLREFERLRPQALHMRFRSIVASGFVAQRADDFSAERLFHGTRQ
jgi:hypothetical protein